MEPKIGKLIFAELEGPEGDSGPAAGYVIGVILREENSPNLHTTYKVSWCSDIPDDLCWIGQEQYKFFRRKYLKVTGQLTNEEQI